MPPARMAFYTAPEAPWTATHKTLPRLAALLRLSDPGLTTLPNDWLEGVYTAESLEDALHQRSQLTHGEVIMTREGHAVSQYSVSFYAPDNEQAGMLARAQEIEHLEREVRAQSLIADSSRAALVRAEAAYSDSAMRLTTVRRQAAEAQNEAHQLQVELLRLTQQAEQTRGRREQIEADLAEVDAQLQELEERAMTGTARFEELDMQLGDAQQRHADLEDEALAVERRLAEAVIPLDAPHALDEVPKGRRFQKLPHRRFNRTLLCLLTCRLHRGRHQLIIYIDIRPAHRSLRCV